jgi:hypothetical protein
MARSLGLRAERPQETKQKSKQAKEILARAYIYSASQDWSIILKFMLGNTPRLEYRALIFGNQIKKGNRLGKK